MIGLTASWRHFPAPTSGGMTYDCMTFQNLSDNVGSPTTQTNLCVLLFLNTEVMFELSRYDGGSDLKTTARQAKVERAEAKGGLEATRRVPGPRGLSWCVCCVLFVFVVWG